MAKLRVYELARELGKETKTLEEVIRGLGIDIKNYMSTLSAEDAERVRRHLASPGDEASTVETRIAKTVIRRRGTGGSRRGAGESDSDEVGDESTSAPETTPPAVAPPRAPTPPITRRPEPVAAQPTMTRPFASESRPSVPMAPASSRASDAAASTAKPMVRTNEPPAPIRVEDPELSRSRPAANPPPQIIPQVGTRIELPKGTRRLPGGMASRQAEEAAVVQSSKPRASAVSGSSASAGASSAARLPGRNGPSAPQGQQVVAKSVETAAPKGELGETTARASGEPTAAVPSRVVRNEQGVIVGAASARTQPKILGFIPLENRRKRQQVIVTDASEEDRRGRASQRKQREERAQAQSRRRKMMRPLRKGGALLQTSRPGTAEMSEAKKRIRVDEAIRVADLAHHMGQKATNLLKVLWGMGLRGLTINHAIDFETAELVAGEFGYTVENVSFQETEITGHKAEREGGGRAPVVTLMGHVDHGKTSLLDKIREARVAEGEAGGITQHIGAYKVHTPKGDVVFLDTPGHEAFQGMRARGALITDVVVVVIAADDGVMPTTVEAIKHARDARVPVIIALNKVDKPDANPGRVKQALMEYGLVGEEFGGETIICEVSAKTGQGVPQLLEMLALQAEILELHAPTDGRAQGTVVEARVDKGRGPIVTVLVQSGTLRRGDILVGNEFSGKVRGLYDDKGNAVEEVGPSTPVEVLGLDGVPSAGDIVNVVESERDARQLIQHRREQRRRKESARSGPSIQEMLQRKRASVFKVVLKSDVQGSAEALRRALEELSTDKIKVEVLKSEVGAINETDVKLARAGEAVLFGFNVKTAGKAATVAEQEKVPVHTFSVIYEALDRARELMVGMLEPEYRERDQGEAEVRALFPIPRLGVVAGCRVTRGTVTRSSRVRVVRGGEVLFKGGIHSLRVFKDDVREVKEGFECGIVVDGFDGVQPGDVIQAFEMEALQPTL